MPEPYPELERLVEAVREAPAGPVLVLGAVDTGKSTLVRQLAEALVADGLITVADADVGQSWLGPPTTMNRATISRRAPDWGRVRPDHSFFVGGTSPAVNLRRAVECLGRLVTESVDPGSRVLVDPPGLAIGPLAEKMWQGVARRVSFRRIIALQHEWELEPVLLDFREAGTVVVPAAPNPAVRRRSPAERTAAREAAFRRHFRGARLRYLQRGRIEAEPLAPQPLDAPDGLTAGRLVGLSSLDRTFGLGVVRAVGDARLGFITPVVTLASVTRVHVGNLNLDPATGCETPI